MLTTAANNALARTVTVPGTVVASASSGDIWLTGRVRNRYEQDEAERVVVAGVRGINDDIEVFTDIEAADVTNLVQDALDRYGLMAVDTDVRVEASDGTVTLTGHVRTWAEHDTVVAAAWRGLGVKKVCDYVVVMG